MALNDFRCSVVSNTITAVALKVILHAFSVAQRTRKSWDCRKKYAKTIKKESTTIFSLPTSLAYNHSRKRAKRRAKGIGEGSEINKNLIRQWLDNRSNTRKTKLTLRADGERERKWARGREEKGSENAFVKVCFRVDEVEWVSLRYLSAIGKCEQISAFPIHSTPPSPTFMDVEKFSWPFCCLAAVRRKIAYKSDSRINSDI